MTNPITPEVRASMDIVERSRKWANENRRCPWESPDFDGCGIARTVYWAHLETIADAMLSLFPLGMPEPWIDATVNIETGNEWLGLFVPLERVES